MKIGKLLCFMLITVLLFAACASPTVRPTATGIFFRETAAENYYQIYGKKTDGLTLVPSVISFNTGTIQGNYTRVANAILGIDALYRTGYTPVLSGEVALHKIVHTGNILYINLDGYFNELPLNSRLLTVMALTNTFTQFRLVDYVYILVNSRPLHFSEWPDYYPGALAFCPVALPEMKALAAENTEKSLKTPVPLFYNIADSDYLLASVKTLASSREGLLADVLTQLMHPGADADISRDYLDVTPAQPQYLQGENRLVLEFYTPELTLEPGIYWPPASALVTTYFYLLPELAWVNITVKDKPEGTVLYSLIARPADYISAVSGRALIYLPNQNASGLYTYTTHFTEDARDGQIKKAIEVLLASRFAGMSAIATQIGLDSLTIADEVLQIWVSGNIAYVNLSDKLYAAFEKLAENQEKQLAFSLVNTICGISGADYVQLLSNGSVRRYFGTSIVIEKPLLRSA